MNDDAGSAPVTFRRPLLVGIVNITEDSFSDGGRYLNPPAAIEHARRLLSDGADIVELGAAASHPGSRQVSAEEQVRRLRPVMTELQGLGAEVGIDSCTPETQRFAFSSGAFYVNDINGFPEPDFYDQLAAASCRLVIMHSVQRLGPATLIAKEPSAVISSIYRFFEERLTTLLNAGVDENRMIIDPGLGYFLSTDPAASIAVLAGIGGMKEFFGLPVLISPSRKSFLRRITGRELQDIGSATLAAEMFATLSGVDYIRTHDVRAIGDALTVLAAIDACGGASGLFESW